MNGEFSTWRLQCEPFAAPSPYLEEYLCQKQSLGSVHLSTEGSFLSLLHWDSLGPLCSPNRWKTVFACTSRSAAGHVLASARTKWSLKTNLCTLLQIWECCRLSSIDRAQIQFWSEIANLTVFSMLQNAIAQSVDSARLTARASRNSDLPEFGIPVYDNQLLVNNWWTFTWWVSKKATQQLPYPSQ